LIARIGLSECFVDPALRFLAGRGAGFIANHRLKALTLEGDRVAALTFEQGAVALAAGDAVVLAVPPRNAAELVPGLIVPDLSRAIVNGHFRLPAARGDFSFLGLVGGVSQWLFVRGAVASVTVSAADKLAEDDAVAIAYRLWGEVCRALALGNTALPAHRIVKEKRATFAQTPDQVRRRPPTRTSWKNLFLAGDWTQTGLPATIEGGIRSGCTAAETVIWAGSRA